MGFFVFQTVDSINKVFKSGGRRLPHSWTVEFERVGTLILLTQANFVHKSQKTYLQIQ